MRALRYAALALVALIPLVAAAQSTNSSVSSLLAELAALEQQIQSLTGSTSSAGSTSSPVVVPPSSTPAPTTNLCPDLSRSLSLGESGADVAGLQEFLAQEDIFHAIATGYFGTLTQSAVAEWQEQNGVVSGGDAASTGLGVVGPKTRAAMESLCQSSSSAPTQSQCMQTLPPSTECPTGWQPVADQNGCTMYYQCSIPLPNATSTSATSTGEAASCPAVQKPTCSGTIESYQTPNGCTAYECVL